MSKAILVDTTRCTGCDKCGVACKEENQLGKDVPRRWKMSIDDLSSTRYTTLLQRDGNRFVRRFCRHCNEPACVSACLVGALQKTPEGPVIYDPDRCMGCRYCMTSCPYGIPRYDWEKAMPFVRKCTMCYPRLQEGKQPACVEACPHEVTLFGERDELLIEAHRRIEAEPDKYVDHVWGEDEVGGTSVIYISDTKLDFLGFQPQLDARPLPDLTWAALKKVPTLVVGMTGLMSGMWWITGRRNKIAEEAHQREVAKRLAEAKAAESDDAPKEEEGAGQ
jgi:formate dehydrogenase iron-sulfur subunit